MTIYERQKGGFLCVGKVENNENETFNFYRPAWKLDRFPVWGLGCRTGDAADLHGY